MRRRGKPREERMKVAVFYGGKSCEHEVSIATGVQIMNAAAGYEILSVYVGRDGKWLNPKKATEISSYRSGAIKGKPCYAKAGDPAIYVGRRRTAIDAAIICNHGYGGEDGCLQGILESAGIAYTGCGVAASAIGMDKRLSRRAFKDSGLKITEGFAVNRDRFSNDLRGVADVTAKLGYPVIVKPASLGSSIGVGVAHDIAEFLDLLSAAFRWDNAAVIERALPEPTELNCAVIGDEKCAEASLPERPLSAGEILGYADKYARGGFKGKGSGRKFPADIPEELAEKVREQAKIAFRAVGASGIARVDFLYSGGELYVNEINTVPGSLALYLFPEYRYGGLTGGAAVIAKLVAIAKENKRARDGLSYRYSDPIYGSKI